MSCMTDAVKLCNKDLSPTSGNEKKKQLLIYTPECRRGLDGLDPESLL